MIEAFLVVAFAVVGVVVCAIFAYANWYLRHDWGQEYGNDAGSPTGEFE